jgi:hypothetical protein
MILLQPEQLSAPRSSYKCGSVLQQAKGRGCIGKQRAGRERGNSIEYLGKQLQAISESKYTELCKAWLIRIPKYSTNLVYCAIGTQPVLHIMFIVMYSICHTSSITFFSLFSHCQIFLYVPDIKIINKKISL